MAADTTCRTLTADFDAAAVDISPRMLELSRRLNPSVEHYLGRYAHISTARPYLRRRLDSRRHLLYAYRGRSEGRFHYGKAHLRPGGLFLVAPDLVRDTFRPDMSLRWSTQRDGVEIITEETVYDENPADTLVESQFTYTITENGAVRVERDIHVTGIFPIATWMSLLEETGFTAGRIPLPGDGDGCGEHLFCGVLRPE